MFKLVGNRGFAAAAARLLLVCFLFAMGGAQSAKADEYQYTVTFGTSADSFGLGAVISFDTSSILNGATSTDVRNVRVLESIQGDDLTTLTGLSFDGQNFFLQFFAPCGVTSRGCTVIPGQYDELDTYVGVFLAPITAPGTYSFYNTNVESSVFGAGIQQESLPGTLSILATPEPNTALLTGGCFLVCAVVGLRRKFRSSAGIEPTSQAAEVSMGSE